MAPIASNLTSFDSENLSLSNHLKEKENGDKRLEEMLKCDEILDRASPLLWPQSVPGLLEFVRENQYEMRIEEDIQEIKFDNLDREDYDIIFCLRDKPNELFEKIKEMNDIAFQLDIEEAKELTRGTILDVFNQSNEHNQLMCNGYHLIN